MVLSPVACRKVYLAMLQNGMPYSNNGSFEPGSKSVSLPITAAAPISQLVSITNTETGVVFTSARVLRVETNGITIYTKNGLARIPSSALSQETRDQFITRKQVGGEQRSSLNDVKASYEAASIEIGQTCAKRQTDSLKQYARALEELLSSTKQSGDLDAYLAVEAEKKRFSREGVVPEASKCAPVLASTVQAFHSSVAEARTALALQAAALSNDYVEALNGRIKVLMQTDRIEEAKVVREERDKALSKVNTAPSVAWPTVMDGIYINRNPALRGTVLARYGGSAFTEAAVLRSLRWLKKYQDSDGKWTTSAGGSASGSEGPASPAMTGLALLTFLAHGETPSSAEFGPTVERGLRWLVDNQDGDGHFAQSDSHEYSLPIAAYALCEAYALTKVTMLKDAAQKSLEVIIKGQTTQGLWTYNCVKGYRNDISYGGWCIQAVKAAVLAGLDNRGLKECAHRAIGGIRSNAGPSGFDYTGPGVSRTLTPVGVLCLQLLGAGKVTQATIPMQEMLKAATCDWQNPWTGDPLYCWYYLTQAKFQRSDADFLQWNKQFALTLMKNQTVVPKAIADTNGVMVDVGYWTPASSSEKCKANCYNTTLCALMLQVYYRYARIPAVSAAAGIGP